LTNGSGQNIIAWIRGSRRQVADIKSESRPASNRNRWPASCRNAWPASSESATTLFAAVSVLEGKVIGRCVPRHRHQEFIWIIATVERSVPAGKVIHAVLDN
jgi:hypothetical protein